MLASFCGFQVKKYVSPEKVVALITNRVVIVSIVSVKPIT